MHSSNLEILKPPLQTKIDGHSDVVLDTFHMWKYNEIKGEDKGKMWVSHFFNQTIVKVKNRPVTFSKPAPKASTVLDLGTSSIEQIRTIYRVFYKTAYGQ